MKAVLDSLLEREEKAMIIFHRKIFISISGLLDILVLFKPQKYSGASQSLIPGVVTLLALKKNKY